MQIAITTSSFDVDHNPVLARLRAAGFGIVTNPTKRRLSEQEVGELLANPGVVGMIAGVEPLTQAVLRQATGLKVLSRCGTGLDNVDLGTAATRGILVRNTPDAPAAAVAELAMALMLAVLRRVAEADRAMRAGTWKSLQGGLLGARTVGVIGLGRIGRRVAGLCQAFGARVVAHDPMMAGGAVPTVPLVSLETLLRQSDVVTLHCAASEGGPVLDAARLALLPAGAVVVNTARGALVDENALHAALEGGHLAGAGLDVFADEPYHGPLMNLQNVVLTAHMGSAALETRRQMELEAAANLERALKEAGLIPNAS
ncbi:NAD(P)-dependent oxidoreductase [Pararhodospirillum oryzae]|uniref:2-hydroxyacid dehydrogenase n=1 Tax=Pararhodospirillum oryzae TaxID=478448 RepID=A0A512H9P0_9PROT|nr:NAD(P)-dependent oxidoreductase [Pararhodospirillum oryzae]GEO82169.1 2-hydroxyacid dehydrogenase [Pararhodospirillum oryzae]